MAMFRADGIGVRKRDDGQIEAKVAIVDVRRTQEKKLFEQVFVGANKASIKAQVDAVLAKLKLNEDDATLNQQFVGPNLSSI